MLEFLSLASGSSGNFYCLVDGESRLAIECGVRFSEIQKALAFKVTSLDGCLVSHAHGDHCLSVDRMMSAGVDCWASTETWIALEHQGKASQGHHRAKILSPMLEARIGPWAVFPFEVPHDLRGTLGFIVRGPSNESVAYITDAMYSPYRLGGVKILAIECNWSEEILKANVASGSIDRERFRRTANTHMSLERLLKMLEANDLSQVEEIVLLHLSSTNSDEARFKSAVERATGIPCVIAPEVSL